MKFDYCIGNPPYQGVNHQQIYPDFYLTAQSIANTVEMIFPTGWQKPTNANNLQKMNTPEVKNDKRVVFINNVHNVFSGITGAEWTNIIMWKQGYDNGLEGKQRLLVDGEKQEDISLDCDMNNRISLAPEVASALHKVQQRTDDSLTSIMVLQNKYDLDALYRDVPDLKSIIGSDGKDKRVRNDHLGKITVFHDEQEKGDMKFYGVIHNIRVCKYIKRKYIDDYYKSIDKYSVLVATAAAGKNFGDKLSPLVICEPNEGYTQTFIGVGTVDNIDTARNIEKYMKTKFVRTMLYTLKCSQQNSIKTWANVPLQDFTAKSDIDWSQSIADIDKQLYKKYGLSKAEIEFIETNVKAMA